MKKMIRCLWFEFGMLKGPFISDTKNAFFDSFMLKEEYSIFEKCHVVYILYYCIFISVFVVLMFVFLP